MLRRFLGISALLSLALVASAASASGPRSPYQRVEQVARFSPDRVQVRHAAPTTVSVERTTPHRQVVQKPGVERIRPSVDTPSRDNTSTTRQVATSSEHARDGNRKVWERVQRVARCEVDSCGKSMQPTKRDTDRLVPNKGTDPIQKMREENHNAFIIALIRAKIMAKKFPGK